MKRKPYAVQLAAIKAANGRRGFNFFMEQGLGKTATAFIEFSELLADGGRCTRMVVFCPNSFKGGWVREMEDWGFDFHPHIYQSGDDWSNEAFLRTSFKKPPVLIINYDALRPTAKKSPGKKTVWTESAGMQYVRRFIEGRKVYLAIDESIQISTHDASQTVGAIMLSKSFAFVRNLSGKPMKMGPQDLWSQMRAIGELEGMNFFVFRNNFCRMGGFQGKKIIGAANEDVLEEYLAPVTFRATKADWTDLPPKSWATREYSLHPDLMRHYRTMFDEFVVWLESGEAVTIDAAITKYMKLAQIQSGFIFDENKKINWLVPPAKNQRLQSLKTFIADELTGKIIVVYNHKPVRGLLLDEFADMKPVFIHGGMSDEEIQANKDTFNKDRECRMICITKAAKYGHTLLGDQSNRDDACSTMAFFENTYSLDDRSQLEDRSHRHGQLQSMMNYVDFVGTKLDGDMVRGLQLKENIFQTVFQNIRSYRP